MAKLPFAPLTPLPTVEQPRGGLERVLGALDRPGQVVRSILKGKYKTAGKSFLNLLEEAPTLGLLQLSDLPGPLGRAGKAIETSRKEVADTELGLIGNIVTDPLTWLSAGGLGAAKGIALAGAKAGSKKLALRALQKGLTKAGQAAVEQKSTVKLAEILAKNPRAAKAIAPEVLKRTAKRQVMEDMLKVTGTEAGKKTYSLAPEVGKELVEQGGLKVGIPFTRIAKTIPGTEGKDILKYVPAAALARLVGKAPVGKGGKPLSQALGETFVPGYGLEGKEAENFALRASAVGSRMSDISKQIADEIEPLMAKLSNRERMDVYTVLQKFDPEAILEKNFLGMQRLPKDLRNLTPEQLAATEKGVTEATRRVKNNPVAQELLDKIVKLQDAAYAEEKALGLDEGYISQYLRRQYTPESMERYLKETGQADKNFSRLGGRGFVKGRKFETLQDAAAAGLVPEINVVKALRSRLESGIRAAEDIKAARRQWIQTPQTAEEINAVTKLVLSPERAKEFSGLRQMLQGVKETRGEIAGPGDIIRRQADEAYEQAVKAADETLAAKLTAAKDIPKQIREVKSTAKEVLEDELKAVEIPIEERLLSARQELKDAKASIRQDAKLGKLVGRHLRGQYSQAKKLLRKEQKELSRMRGASRLDENLPGNIDQAIPRAREAWLKEQRQAALQEYRAQRQALREEVGAHLKGKAVAAAETYKAERKDLKWLLEQRQAIVKANVAGAKTKQLMELGQKYKDSKEYARFWNQEARRKASAVRQAEYDLASGQNAAQHAQATYLADTIREQKRLIAAGPKMRVTRKGWKPTVQGSLAEAIQRTVPEERGAIMSKIAAFNRYFKPAATSGLGPIPNPSFIVRNIMSGQFQSAMDPRATIGNMLSRQARRIISNLDKPEELRKIGKVGDYTAEEVAALLRKHNVTRNTYAETELLSQGLLGKTRSKTANTILNAATKLTQGSESWMRGSHFISLLKKGVPPAEAAASTRKVFVDYSVASNTARNLRDVIPFSQFTIGTLPPLMETLVRRPRFATPIREGYKIAGGGEEEAPMPEWMASQPTIPLGKDEQGNRKYLTQLGTIFEQLNIPNQGGFAKTINQSVLGAMTPVLKVPAQIVTGKDFFFGGDLTYGKTPKFLQALGAPEQMDPRARALLGVNPYVRQTNIIDKMLDERRDWMDKALNLITGARTYSVDEKREMLARIKTYLQEKVAAGDVGVLQRFYSKSMDPELAALIKSYHKELQVKKAVAARTAS